MVHCDTESVNEARRPVERRAAVTALFRCLFGVCALGTALSAGDTQVAEDATTFTLGREHGLLVSSKGIMSMSAGKISWVEDDPSGRANDFGIACTDLRSVKRRGERPDLIELVMSDKSLTFIVPPTGSTSVPDVAIAVRRACGRNVQIPLLQNASPHDLEFAADELRFDVQYAHGGDGGRRSLTSARPESGVLRISQSRVIYENLNGERVSISCDTILSFKIHTDVFESDLGIKTRVGTFVFQTVFDPSVLQSALSRKCLLQ